MLAYAMNMSGQSGPTNSTAFTVNFSNTIAGKTLTNSSTNYNGMAGISWTNLIVSGYIVSNGSILNYTITNCCSNIIYTLTNGINYKAQTNFLSLASVNYAVSNWVSTAFVYSNYASTNLSPAGALVFSSYWISNQVAAYAVSNGLIVTAVTNITNWTTNNFPWTSYTNISANTNPGCLTYRVHGYVTTFAGSGAPTYADGQGTNASFNGPRNLAIDSLGNIYVADDYNNRIRKISPSGVVSIIAGSGTAAFADGTGTNASFNQPHGISLDSLGNIYVADLGNNRIRKITTLGVVNTIAGSGNGTFADGTGTNASFHFPCGVTVDNLGNIYIADTSNNRIRKITTLGVVSTIAGSGTAAFADGTGTNASFSIPNDVVVDSLGNIYVADANNLAVRLITPAGVVTTIAGHGFGVFTDGIPFSTPDGITLDSSGNVYLGDFQNCMVRMITPAGIVTTVAGSTVGYADGLGTNARFNSVCGVVLDSFGNIYVADSGNNRIRKIYQ